MSACICSSCKNLKSIIDEVDSNENEITEECEFGFPAESCCECDVEGCELTCEHYEKDCEADELVSVQCSKCGKELKVAATNEEAGEVYCPACYLEQLM